MEAVTTVRTGLVDDHILLRDGLGRLITSFNTNHGHKFKYEVILQADNGMDLIRQLKHIKPPEILLLDINMPEMDGYETAVWLKRNYPEIKILGFSMYDTDTAIIRMLKNGVKGYLVKDAEPKDLNEALDSLMTKGFYYSDLVTKKVIGLIDNLDMAKSHPEDPQPAGFLGLNDREVEFLKLTISEHTYKEIAEKMGLSPRTIDGYRDSLFEKLNVKTRVGLAMYAIKSGLISVNSIDEAAIDKNHISEKLPD